MKKILSLLLIGCLLTSAICTVSATSRLRSTEGQNITMGQEPDWDNFYANAQVVSCDESGVVLKEKDDNSDISRSYNASSDTTTVKLLPSDEENAQELITLVQNEQRKRSQANYREIAEQAGFGVLYSTVYFSKVYDSRGAAYYKIDTVGAGFRGDLTSGTRIQSAKLLIGQSGSTMSNGYKTQTKYATGDFSNVYPPASWYPVLVHSSSDVGCVYTLTLTRGTGSWSTELVNNLRLA